MSASAVSNQLAHETSPYLQQHAANPVAWQPWNAAALALAQSQDKPILLSIGYSACHWCHVMAHESFEDEATAALMNELFINIKVDREERPDLDKIYQAAYQLLMQRPGGWPLTVFLTPADQMPYFAGTYFPREARYGMPAFADVLRQMAQIYHERQADIRQQHAALGQALQTVYNPPTAATSLQTDWLSKARDELASLFDAQRGGFGAAPKFPHVTFIERLLRHWAGRSLAGEADTEALQMATFTLRSMAEGGIFDHLGGGFARYSVDDDWLIPHFEKMLYDNGPLLALYAQAYAATGETLLRERAELTAAWALGTMQSPEGGFYASLDADSEGVEGKYYLWDRDEVQRLLDTDSYTLFARRYGLDRPANFEGQWHLYGACDRHSLAAEVARPPDTVAAQLEQARKRLLQYRQQRVPPGRDDKLLTSWNALMIRGLAIAARHLQQPELAAAASRAVDCLYARVWCDGRLLATYKDGRAQHRAYLDDHAFLLDALLELLQIRWRSADLRWAIELAELLIQQFADSEHGGFWFTAADHEALVQRPKSFADESVPAGNGVAAYALQRLGGLLAEPRYLSMAETTLQAASSHIGQAPSAHASLLNALEEYFEPPRIIILRGQGQPLADWQQQGQAGYSPRQALFAIPADAADLPPALAEKTLPTAHPIAAYVCQGTQCLPSCTEEAELTAALTAARARPTSKMMGG